jgi:hypothetical protein
MSDHEIELKIYTGSIQRGSEYHRLYTAIDEAARNGASVTITRGSKTFRLVPEPQGCVPCQDGRHEDCVLIWTSNPDSDSCGCDQRSLHARQLAERVAAYRLSRR